jgi:hypothetical protein
MPCNRQSICLSWCRAPTSLTTAALPYLQSLVFVQPTYLNMQVVRELLRQGVSKSRHHKPGYAVPIVELILHITVTYQKLRVNIWFYIPSCSILHRRVPRKLTVVEIVKTRTARCRNQMLTTIFKHHTTGSYPDPDQSSKHPSLHIFKILCNNIFPFAPISTTRMSNENFLCIYPLNKAWPPSQYPRYHLYYFHHNWVKTK